MALKSRCRRGLIGEFTIRMYICTWLASCETRESGLTEYTSISVVYTLVYIRVDRHNGSSSLLISGPYLHMTLRQLLRSQRTGWLTRSVDCLFSFQSSGLVRLSEKILSFDHRLQVRKYMYRKSSNKQPLLLLDFWPVVTGVESSNGRGAYWSIYGTTQNIEKYKTDRLQN